MYCPSCKDVSMENDIHGTETALVCTKCGYMAVGKNQSFSSDLVHDEVMEYSINEPSLNIKYKTDVDKDEKRIRARAKARSKYILSMRTCLQSFTSNSMVFEDAKSIFENMVSNEDFLHKKEKCKSMLAAGCVFHALRRYNMSVTVLAVCSKIGVPSYGMSKILRLISDKTEPVVRFDESGIKAIIMEYNTMKDNPARVDKAMHLLKLLESMSMTVGRQPHTIAIAVAYLAYVCEQKTKRVCTSMIEFIKINKLGLNNPTDLMVEVKKRIILMVKRLPWIVSDKIEMKRYHKYIDDILPNHDSLLLLPATKLTNKDIIVRQLNNQENELNVPAHVNPKTDLDVLNNAWNKKKIVKKPEAVKQYPAASNSNILTENDLPESEINLYIRSNEEVKKIKEIREKLDFNETIYKKKRLS